MPEDENHIFYNVLPPEKAVGPLANAPDGTPSVTTASTSMTETNGGGILAKLEGQKRLILIIAIALIVLIGAGLTTYLIIKKRNTVAQPVPVSVGVSEPNEEPVVEQPAGVTTPADWQKRYFGSEVCQTLEVCGDTSDPDRDGLINIDENKANTDPNNPDSSGGGIADGDKVNVFAGDPLKSKSKPGDYTDADYYKYGYDLNTDQLYTPEKLEEIKNKIKQFGLHQPTIKTLGDEALSIYDFVNPNPDPEETPLSADIDQSSTAKLERDTQRSSTIKKIGSALLKYKKDHSTYPDTTEFTQMTDKIKPYILVATNFNDPINQDKYVYGYMSANKAQDFTLTYFSETQNLLIKYKAQDAETNETKESSSAYDDQRKRDMDNIRTALLLYSSRNIDSQSEQVYVFPPADKYKTALVPQFISAIPKDPRTNKDYEYKVGQKYDTFTLKVLLDNPAPGTTGYLCNQEECQNY